MTVRCSAQAMAVATARAALSLCARIFCCIRLHSTVCAAALHAVNAVVGCSSAHSLLVGGWVVGFDRIPQPIIAAVHSACVGGGVDLICAADVRVCSADAWFCIKEIDIAMTADVGTFPRLLKITGNDSLVRELAFTGRALTSKEALQMGLVSTGN